MQKIIKSGKSQLTIDTQGGKIIELMLDDKKILGTYSRIDGKTGSTHICTPNFAGEGMIEYGLPFHGPARNMEWQLVSESEDMIEISVTLEALEKYKSALEVKQIFRLDSSHSFRMTEIKPDDNPVMLSSPKHPEKISFHHSVHVKNIGPLAVPVNIGIHNYFDTPNGWKETKIDNKLINKEIKNNLSVPIVGHPIKQAPATDLPDSGATSSPRMISKLVFSPTSSLLIIETQGAADFVTWTGVKNGKYNDDFACVEPVCWYNPKLFGTPISLLNPGEKRNLSQKLSLGSLL